MTRLATVLAVAAALLAPARSQAEAVVPFDHLKCYAVTHLNPVQHFTFDVTPRDTRFTAETGCRIRGKPTQLCVPAAKLNVHPTPPGAPAGVEAGSFLCYHMTCPRPDKQTLSFTDQFGTRNIQARTPNLFCTPTTLGGDQEGFFAPESFLTASR